MDSITTKIKSNLKNGTLFQNGAKFAYNRLVKRIRSSNLFYRFNAARVLTKKYQEKIPYINTNHISAGNYFIDKRLPLDVNSVVYSLGILSEISFDRSITETYGCTVHMYDPTPISIDYMQRHNENKLLNFYPLGVWTENTTLKFYQQATGGSASALNVSSTDYFEAQCYTMKTLMEQNGHSAISIFKADIEGAALPILKQMVHSDIFPDQIIVELERPRTNHQSINSFFDDVSEIRSILNQRGYEEYLIPRKASKYYSFEFLFVNAKLFN